MSAKNAFFFVFQFLVVFAELTFTFELALFMPLFTEKSLTPLSKYGKI